MMRKVGLCGSDRKLTKYGGADPPVQCAQGSPLKRLEPAQKTAPQWELARVVNYYSASQTLILHLPISLLNQWFKPSRFNIR